VIVDAHTHVVAPDRAAYPLSPRPLSGAWYEEAPCSAEELAVHMDAAGVDRAVLVQGVGAYSFDNRYAADSAAAMPERFVSACCVDPDGDDPVGTLEHWLGERGMQGVRLFALAAEGASWLADPRTFPLWECAAMHDAHVIVTIFAHQLSELRSMLERFPEIPVSLDHCGFPEIAAPEPLLAMADLGNLHLKVSTHVLDSAVKADGEPAPFVHRLVDFFGAERIMWGSDFCQTHDRSYGELVALGRRAFCVLDADSQAACLGGTARRLWRGLG
jgi:predicted TIM-barrel fold metal-dependent hydrolase